MTVWSRVGVLAQAQPAATIPRVSGIATFTWIGDDPNVKTPHVTLQRDSGGSNWADVQRRFEAAVAQTPGLIA